MTSAAVVVVAEGVVVVVAYCLKGEMHAWYMAELFSQLPFFHL